MQCQTIDKWLIFFQIRVFYIRLRPLVSSVSHFPSFARNISPIIIIIMPLVLHSNPLQGRPGWSKHDKIEKLIM